MPLPISVTNTFANATSAIPLSQLDANFTTVVNGVNGIGNGTNSLSNVSITGGTIDNTPIGNTTPTTGKFTIVTVPVQTSGTGLAMLGRASDDLSQVLGYSSNGATLFGQIQFLSTGGGALTFVANGGERIRVGGAGQIGIAGANYGTSGQVLTSGGASAAVSWSSLVNQSSTAPTVTTYTSGSGTYTLPTGVKWLRVRMVGGGGGGGGSGSGGTTGGTGGSTTFGSSFLTCNGGAGGQNNGPGGAGGSASLAAGASGLALTGGDGGGAPAGVANNLSSGIGAPSPFGGGGGSAGGDSAGSPNSNPSDGKTNTGGGGGGASWAGSYAAGGGGAGGYVDVIIGSPSSSYSYAIGAGGTAGTAGTGTAAKAGAAGGSGVIFIEEHYNY